MCLLSIKGVLWGACPEWVIFVFMCACALVCRWPSLLLWCLLSVMPSWLNELIYYPQPHSSATCFQVRYTTIVAQVLIFSPFRFRINSPSITEDQLSPDTLLGRIWRCIAQVFRFLASYYVTHPLLIWIWSLHGALEIVFKGSNALKGRDMNTWLQGLYFSEWR